MRSGRHADEVAATAEVWRAAGGTHLSVCSMRLGLDSVEAHLDFFSRGREKLHG